MRSLLVFLFALLPVIPIPASMAFASSVSLRNSIVVRGGMVRLSDLFAGLQPTQDCDIGPSPEPGKRISILPSQLAAIASEFDVDWQPGLAYQAATLERAARIVTRDEVVAVIRPALVEDGAAPDVDVSLAAFVSPNLSVEVTTPPAIQSLDYDRQSGRFSAFLLFTSPGLDQTTVRVAGRAEQQVNVMTLTHALPAGASITPGDLVETRVRLNGLRGTPVTERSAAVGLALRRPLGEGVPLLQNMLVRPMMISRGRPVVLRLQSFGLQLTAAGTALEAGAEGDRIHVVNSLSHAILVGQITSGAEIQIDPGTAPVISQTIGGENGLPRLPANASGDGQGFSSYAQEAQNR